MGWIKEGHGVRDFGFRREDNLAYVGKSASGWWRAFVRIDATDDFELLSREGYSNDTSAKNDADNLLEGLMAA